MEWSPGAVAVELRDISQTSFVYMNITFDKLLSEIDNVLTKG